MFTSPYILLQKKNKRKTYPRHPNEGKFLENLLSFKMTVSKKNVPPNSNLEAATSLSGVLLA
jgi:hypothetical protein